MFPTNLSGTQLNGYNISATYRVQPPPTDSKAGHPVTGLDVPLDFTFQIPAMKTAVPISCNQTFIIEMKGTNTSIQITLKPSQITQIAKRRFLHGSQGTMVAYWTSALCRDVVQRFDLVTKIRNEGFRSGGLSRCLLD